MKKPKINLPVWDFPHFGDYRCCICQSRSGPFFDDSAGKKGIDFLCTECHNEVVEVRSYWNMVDQMNEEEIASNRKA